MLATSSYSSTTTVESLPVISVIEPTPAKLVPKLQGYGHLVAKPTPTRTRQAQSHRLLYKGSLTLSDSHTDVPLEGICFVAHLPPTSPTSFLNSPLPLALESMHGRPSLQITSIIPLASVAGRLDDASDVRLYWHPDAYLASEFFLKVIWTLGGWDEETGRSNRCVKIALGDEEISEENELIIYAQGSPSSSSTVNFMVTRLLPPVARSTSRVPRPDDPLPRRPNSIYASPGRKGTKRGHNRQDESPERDKERSKKKGKIILPDKHLSSTATGRMPFSRTQTMPALVFGGVGTVRDRAPSPAFINNGALLQAMGGLRRSTMARSHSRGSSISSVAIEDDVFKVPDPVVHAPLKGNIVRASGGSQESDAVREVSELELANKNAIKRQTTAVLAFNGVPKDDPEFRDLYNWVQRGVAFALRKTINVKRLERDQIKALVTKHVEMYMDEPVADPNAMDLG